MQLSKFRMSTRQGMVILVILSVLTTTTSGQTFLYVNGTKLVLNGEKVFLSGMNQAWYSYGADFGNTDYAKSRPHLIGTLDDIHSSGGNSIRVWLHVDGLHTPLFNNSGYVTGVGPNLTRDMTDFLHEAQARNILVTITLWNCAVFHDASPLAGLMSDRSKLQSYLDNALAPMVRALASQRALGVWEIINEPEGCIKPEVKNVTRPCYDTTTLHWDDFSDWTGARLPLETVLYFIATQAHTIHTADPKALVTVGSWTYKTVTDHLDRRNFYSDHCLMTVTGGQPGAKLDMYQIHTYDFLFVYLPHDPFMVNSDVYRLDKPVVIGEFSQKKGGMMTSVEQFTWAYYHGYSGAMSWCALGSDSASDDIATQKKGIGSLKDENDQSNGGRVNINIQNQSRVLYSIMRVVTSVIKFCGGVFSFTSFIWIRDGLWLAQHTFVCPPRTT